MTDITSSLKHNSWAFADYDTCGIHYVNLLQIDV